MVGSGDEQEEGNFCMGSGVQLGLQFPITDHVQVPSATPFQTRYQKSLPYLTFAKN